MPNEFLDYNLTTLLNEVKAARNRFESATAASPRTQALIDHQKKMLNILYEKITAQQQKATLQPKKTQGLLKDWKKLLTTITQEINKHAASELELARQNYDHALAELSQFKSPQIKDGDKIDNELNEAHKKLIKIARQAENLKKSFLDKTTGAIEKSNSDKDKIGIYHNQAQNIQVFIDSAKLIKQQYEDALGRYIAQTRAIKKPWEHYKSSKTNLRKTLNSDSMKYLLKFIELPYIAVDKKVRDEIRGAAQKANAIIAKKNPKDPEEAAQLIDTLQQQLKDFHLPVLNQSRQQYSKLLSNTHKTLASIESLLTIDQQNVPESILQAREFFSKNQESPEELQKIQQGAQYLTKLKDDLTDTLRKEVERKIDTNLALKSGIESVRNNITAGTQDALLKDLKKRLDGIQPIDKNSVKDLPLEILRAAFQELTNQNDALINLKKDYEEEKWVQDQVKIIKGKPEKLFGLLSQRESIDKNKLIRILDKLASDESGLQALKTSLTTLDLPILQFILKNLDNDTKALINPNLDFLQYILTENKDDLQQFADNDKAISAANFLIRKELGHLLGSELLTNENSLNTILLLKSLDIEKEVLENILTNTSTHQAFAAIANRNLHRDMKIMLINIIHAHLLRENDDNLSEGILAIPEDSNLFNHIFLHALASSLEQQNTNSLRELLSKHNDGKIAVLSVLFKHFTTTPDKTPHEKGLLFLKTHDMFFRQLTENTQEDLCKLAPIINEIIVTFDEEIKRNPNDHIKLKNVKTKVLKQFLENHYIAHNFEEAKKIMKQHLSPPIAKRIINKIAAVLTNLGVIATFGVLGAIRKATGRDYWAKKTKSFRKKIEGMVGDKIEPPTNKNKPK